MTKDLNRTTYPIDKYMEYFDKTIIGEKIDEILRIIKNTVGNSNINNNDYKKLLNNLDFLKNSQLGVKYKSSEGVRISEYSYVISKINEYTNRIKIEAEKYLNKSLRDEDWEIINK